MHRQYLFVYINKQDIMENDLCNALSVKKSNWYHLANCLVQTYGVSQNHQWMENEWLTWNENDAINENNQIPVNKM